jgi:hypothetical protein
MRRFLSAAVLLGLVASNALAAELTELEHRWLTGIWPVVVHARELKLPLDIVVQPQPTPGLTPLGMAFVDGRCKLVLSMRGNPKAQAMLDRIEATLLAGTLELMAAHELGHCHRHLQASFDVLAAGFTATQLPPTLDPELHAAYLAMKATRREEGFSDLVGLAWTKQRHPALYAALHAWLLAERSQQAIRGSDHDTRAWLRLVDDSALLADTSIFDGAAAAWALGLDAEE